MKYLKKYWLHITIILLTVIRFLISCKLPTFYIKNLGLDDYLMIELSNNLSNGTYLGQYCNLALVKGFIFPLLLSLSRFINFSYASTLTIIYISSCIFFTISMKGIIKNKKILVFLYLILLFNPLSYSMELFQRLYRNSLSLIELLFFFSFIIRILKTDNKKKIIINSLFLGLTTGIMYLTREDNIWCMVILILLFIYKFLTNKNIKSFLINLTPITTLYLILNIVSLINYKYYGVYTYNELANSSFKDAYVKVQEIKDSKKINKVSITKESLDKLASVSEKFDITKEEIDTLYKQLADIDTQEINNSTIIWYFRHLIYANKRFINGNDANLYFKELAREIDSLFENGTLEKEFAFNSVFMNTPTLDDLKMIPGNLFKLVKYSTTYENVGTLSLEKLKEIPNTTYDFENKAYYIYYRDYNHTENILEENIKVFEIIRLFYKYFTVIFSVIAIIIYLMNIKFFKDKKYYLTTLILLSYLIILLGVCYTHTTAFNGMRYYYLGNIYILQSIFIVLNLEGVFNERNRINNIITMFKRRKNYR